MIAWKSFCQFKKQSQVSPLPTIEQSVVWFNFRRTQINKSTLQLQYNIERGIKQLIRMSLLHVSMHACAPCVWMHNCLMLLKNQQFVLQLLVKHNGRGKVQILAQTAIKLTTQEKKFWVQNLSRACCANTCYSKLIDMDVPILLSIHLVQIIGI